MFVWYRLYVRGDPGYTPFRKLIDDQDAVTQYFDQDHFNNWYEEQCLLERTDDRAEVLPPSYYPWFERIHQAIASITDSSSDVFLESREWVNRIPEEGRDDLRAYLRVVEAIASSEKSDDQLFQICRRTDEARGSDATVVYTRIDASTWFLIAPTRSRNADDYSSHHLADRETALRSAARAYPAWVLADDDLWLDIQKEADANLALSVEERQILESVAGVGSDHHRLPLFINGQAGSGKSTMLAYLFAGLLKKKLDEDLPGSPVFITYSDRLIESARKATIRLLRTGFDTTEKYQTFDPSDLFVTWQEFLLGLLPEERRSNFLPSKKVSFRDFKAAFEGRRGLLKPFMTGTGRFSPETAWFVIRSLIKGHESSEVFDPDDYESEIPERDRLVSVSDYDTIFRVYFQWYQRQLEEGGLWDDQDLVKEILELEDLNSDSFHSIAALVVDEAQDFTRCELRLLARNLVYTRFDVPNLPDIRVPIILAGDPLQTLSPTGFKWETIRAGLFSELRSMLGEKAHTPEYHPLQNNYRSKPGVVGFANLVQAWRSWMFGLNIKAQGAWSPQDSYAYLPRKFTLDDGSRSIEDFTRLLTDTMTVIPVDEGGEIDFVKNDPILSAIYPDASETSRPFTVLSATAVKGLEFGKVVLYKFGDHQLPQIPWKKTADGHPDLSAEYFFNKLYVGVTRATQDLYVVDTARGTEGLWSHFSAQDAERFTKEMTSFLQPLDERGIPGQLLGIEETIEGLEGLEEKNPRDNALKMKTFGIDTRDSKLIRRAEYFFKRTGDTAEQRLCNAYALRFEDQFVDAAREFLAIDRPREAWEAAWIAADWGVLAEIIRVNPKVDSEEIKEAVLFMMIPSPTSSDSLTAMSAIARLFARKDAPGAADTAWRSFIQRVVTTIDTSGASEVDRGRIADGLDILGKQGFRDAALKAGDILLADGRFEDAENSWLRAGSEAQDRLARLRAEREGLPRGLHHLLEASLYDEVIHEWSIRGRPHSAAWTSAAIQSFKALNRTTEGFDVLVAASAFPEATDLLLEFDPEMQYHGERYKSLIRAIARAREAPLLLQTIEKLRITIPVKEGSSSRIRPLHLYGVEQLVQAHHEAGWPKMTEVWIDSVRRMVAKGSGIRSWDIEETLREADAFVLGAAWELGECWEEASEVYERFFESRDEFKRTESRHRWMFCQMRYEETLRNKAPDGRRRGQYDSPEGVQKRRNALADKWRMSPDERQRAVRQSVPRLSRRSRPGSVARPAGTFQTETMRIDFSLKNNGKTLTINLENQETYDIFSINYIVEDKVARYSGTSHQLDEGAIRWTNDAWSPYWIHITHKEQLVLQLGMGETMLEEYVVIDVLDPSTDAPVAPQRKATPNARTTPSRQSIKGFDLANELGVTVQALRGSFVALGINPRKDGNSRLTADEAQRVRTHFKRRNPTTD